MGEAEAKIARRATAKNFIILLSFVAEWQLDKEWCEAVQSNAVNILRVRSADVEFLAAEPGSFIHEQLSLENRPFEAPRQPTWDYECMVLTVSTSCHSTRLVEKCLVIWACRESLSHDTVNHPVSDSRLHLSSCRRVHGFRTQVLVYPDIRDRQGQQFISLDEIPRYLANL